jgi:hypothetical protein
VLSIGGGYVVFDQPVAGLIDLGHKHAVRVYPCLSQSGLLYRPPRGNGEAFPPAGWFAASVTRYPFLRSGQARINSCWPSAPSMCMRLAPS